MSSWARVGAKCICIKKGAWIELSDGDSEGGDPVYGEVCEIVGFYGPDRFFEIKGYEHVYDPQRFRPLISQEDDISMFKSLLKPTEVPA